MRFTRKRYLLWMLALAVVPATLTWLWADTGKVITGVVTDASGPVAGATVRVQATTVSASTNDRGEFTLQGLPNLTTMPLTAWALG